MGHDIYIMTAPPGPEIVEGEDVGPLRGGQYAHTYISFNWSNHSPSIHDLHGHKGSEIVPFLEHHLQELRKKAIYPSINKGVDGWGNYIQGSSLIEKAAKRRIDRKLPTNQNGDYQYSSWEDYKDGFQDVVHAIDCMHAYHLDRFLQLARQYPEGYWVSDQCYAIIPLPDFESVELTYSQVVQLAKWKLPYEKVGNRFKFWDTNHYGRISITTPEYAMASAKDAALSGDPRAMGWTQLALFLVQNSKQ